MVNEAAGAYRVLVIDDEPLIRWSLAETLVDSGDIVSEAATAEAAVRVLTGEPAPDVVLLDFHLPDSHGLGLLSKIKKLAPTTHVIMMSAYITPDLAAEALATGAHAVVAKPFDITAIRGLVHQTASPVH